MGKVLDQEQIFENYQKVKRGIAGAATAVQRDPDPIKLVVVSKGHTVGEIKEAIAAGIRIFGENYAEEGLEKLQAFERQTGLEWHMIGHVQSRKASLVSEHFDFLHSLDSQKLARRLDSFSAQFDRVLPVLLECNVSGESSKFGWPAWQEDRWDALIPEIAALLTFPNIRVCGLMTLAPFLLGPEEARPYFRRLRHLRDFLSRRFPEANWQELSMGMSADYEAAVKEGATIIRIGTAIMGPRTAQ